MQLDGGGAGVGQALPAPVRARRLRAGDPPRVRGRGFRRGIHAGTARAGRTPARRTCASRDQLSSTTRRTSVKYFSIYIPDAKTNSGRPEGKRKEEMDRFIADSLASGTLLMGGGFLSIRQHGCVMRRSNGKSEVIDGPYAESKELLGGFAML